jgi:hypothetical protein
MDHSGRFIFARVSLGGNDRECYTGSPLYLQEGKYFSDGQFVAADGGFERKVDSVARIKTRAMMYI